VKTKGNKIYNGFPIGQGLIFVGNSLEELIQTKAMTDKEYQEWSKERAKLGLPLAPHEPVASFDMDGSLNFTFSLALEKPCMFIKFVPTAFRKKPVNLSSKAFNQNVAECQFFGVKGHEASCQAD